MSVFSSHFPLGLGTTRLPISGQYDKMGFEKSVDLVREAIEAGVDYIDVGYNYAAGMALPILREAFLQTSRPFAVTAKVMYGQDRTSDDARKKVDLYLNQMSLEKISYFTCWCIWSYADFEKVMGRGGLYEGALQLKQEGVVDHICGSLHCPPEDMIRIIESGVFEGITLSCSLLSAAMVHPVLDAAQKKGVGVAVMNPLGGGIIAQNPNYFSFACGEADQGNTVHAALRFAAAHPAVDIVLGGVNSQKELRDSLAVFSSPDPELPASRMKRVLHQSSQQKGFCTGCQYCEGCPKGIPTAAIMQARNALLFDPVADYNRQSPQELLYNIQIFRKLFFDSGWLPASGENPCIQCGHCERSCTQKLSIMDGVADIYRRADCSGYTEAAHQDRLKELLHGKKYRRVGLYPSGGFSSKVIEIYQKMYSNPEFEWFLFNSDIKIWGQQVDGYVVHAPADIPELNLDTILVCTYKYDKEIIDSLRPYEKLGIRIARLHTDEAVPWIF